MLRAARGPPPPYPPPLPSWNRGQAVAIVRDAPCVVVPRASGDERRASSFSSLSLASFGCCEVDLSTMVFEVPDENSSVSPTLSMSSLSEAMQQKRQRDIDLAEHSDDPEASLMSVLSVMSGSDEFEEREIDLAEHSDDTEASSATQQKRSFAPAGAADRSFAPAGAADEDHCAFEVLHERSRELHELRVANEKLLDSAMQKMLTEYPPSHHMDWDGLCTLCRRPVAGARSGRCWGARAYLMHPVCFRKSLWLAKLANPDSVHYSFSSSSDGRHASFVVIVVTPCLRVWKFLNVGLDDKVKLLAREVAVRMSELDVVLLDPRDLNHISIDSERTWRDWGAKLGDYKELFSMTLAEYLELHGFANWWS